jgi:hypothetical protein
MITAMVFLIVLSVLLGSILGARATGEPLVYLAPVKTAVEPGEMLLGSGIRCLDLTDKGVKLDVGGRETLKRTGDSVAWKGHVYEQVTSDLALRILSYDSLRAHLFGSIKMTISCPLPEPGPIPTNSRLLCCTPVAYAVERGACIPGTTITYRAKSEQGAKLETTEGARYRRPGAAILWTGKLTENTFLELNGRVLRIKNGVLHVAGIARLHLLSDREVRQGSDREVVEEARSG